MKIHSKIISAICILVICLGLGLCPLNSVAKTMTPSGETSKSLTISYSFPHPEVGLSELNATSIGSTDTYSSVTMEGLFQTTETGLPVLPCKTARILLPYGKEFQDIEVTAGKKLALPGSYLVENGQKAVPLSYQGTIEPTLPDAEVYGSRDPFPGRLYSNVSVQNSAGYQILLVNLHPVEYIPASGKLAYYSSFDVKVTFAPESRGQQPYFRGLARDKEHIEGKVDNPGIIDTYSITETTPMAETIIMESSLPFLGDYEYVIITNEELEATTGPYNFQALRDEKISRGITATIVTTEYIYVNYDGTRPDGGTDNQTRIRNFIDDAYQNWGTKYVLLGGDGDGADIGHESGDCIIPHRGFTVIIDEKDFDYDIPADMYYGCLGGTFDYDADGNYGEPGDGEGGGEVDLYAEVYVGRACADSPAEVSNFVRKTLNYQATPDYSNNLSKVSMVGEHLGFGGVADWGGNFKDEIKEGSSAHDYTTVGFEDSDYASSFDVSTLYGRDYPGINWPVSEITSIINDNVHLLNHAGHANVGNLMKMDISEADSLTNDDLHFIGYSQGCYCGAFDNSDYPGMYSVYDAISEHLTTGEHGATAMIVNSRYGWGAPDSTDGPSQHFDREFWDAVLGEGIRNIGIANQDSKEDNDGRVGSSLEDRWCCYELNLLGDPELRIKMGSSEGYTYFSDSGQNLGNSNSYGIALGDLDSDGDLDAFVANSGANEVWLNDGAGNFSDSGQYLGYSYSLNVALGDLDSDGDLDAFVANYGGANKVWLNDGAGSFSDSGQNLGGSYSTDVALGDLDGDGDLDAFVANYYAQANKVWLNDGAGNFSDSGQSLSNSWSSDVALGDLDSDGDLDAFVTNFYGQANKVWLNDGAGNFTNSGQNLGGLSSYDVYLGDLDSDGDLDAFVANYGQANKVWLNDGTGSFNDSGQNLGNSNSYAVDLGDLDGDGDLDAFVANFSQANKFWLNDGNGNFSDSRQILGSSNSWDIALGDLDSDGDLDAFVANAGQANKVWLNHTPPRDTLFTDSGQSLGNTYSTDIALGDLDSDGDLDAFVANNSQANKVWLNDDAGNFSDSGQNLGSSYSWNVDLGDLDGDGDLDAFVANSGANKVWLNDGAGSFTDSGQSLGSSGSWNVALGDLDGDGDLDAFVANPSRTNKVWLNDGAGNFTDSGQNLGSSYSYGIDLGDLDGDGDLDAFVVNASANKVWLNDGAGNFTDSGQNLGSSYSWNIALGDLDGDGDLDAFVTNASQANKVWLNDGAGSFSDSGQDLGSSYSYGIDLGDLDSDGDLDAFVANNSQANKVWLNDGAGSFSDSGQDLGSSSSWNITLGDLDNDGDPDAFVANYNQSNKVWLNHVMPLEIISRTPSVNEIDITADMNIVVVFDTIIRAASVTWDTFNVDGSLSGEIAGSLVGGDSDTITFNPASDFKPGETVTVTLTTNLESITGGTLDTPVTWQFTVAVSEGYVYFPESGQDLGNSNSYGVALGDLDSDGDLDSFVVNANYQANKVWLNNGAGNFSDSGQSLGNSSSFGVALGDLDGDGDLDAFVANYGNADKVWLNDGAGNFSDSGQNLGSSYSYGIDLGDLDGDGDLDAFVANLGQANKVWLNNGAGNFSDSGQSLGNSSSFGVALGDLDGDGDLDAFVANINYQADKVWLNDGAGSFSDSGQNLCSSFSFGVDLGDLDGDGDLDAFVVDGNYQANKVWLNDGTGSFSDSGQSLGSSNSYCVALGDLNGDGDLDAFVANYGNTDRVWLNNGSGSFSDSGQSIGDSNSQDIALGDLDGDGNLDAFVANYNQANKVWLNQMPTWGAWFTDSGQELGSSLYYDAGLGDLDGDGDLDAFVADCWGANKIWLNDNAGSFSDSGQSLGSSNSLNVALGDLDGDGDLDAFVVNNGADKVWLNDGAGNFSDSGQNLVSSDGSGVDLGDLDGDGDLDAFVANRVWLNNGAGVFTDSGQSLGSFNIRGVALGDLDGDGDLDAFIAQELKFSWELSGCNKVWFNDGAGNFSDSGQNLGSIYSISTDVALGDLDGDGDLDAFVTNNNEANEVWLNDGTGYFSDNGQSLGSSQSDGIALGDLDHDGDLDAFVANNSANKVWRNDGSGNFSDSGNSLGSSWSYGVALGDLDSDGDFDAFVVNLLANKVWMNNIMTLEIISRTPSVNELDVTADMNIVVVFDASINAASVTEDTFNVNGSLSGEITGVFSGGDTDTITFDPASDFNPGETVTVTLTTGLESVAGGTLSAPVIWQFTVAES